MDNDEFEDKDYEKDFLADEDGEEDLESEDEIPEGFSEVVDPFERQEPEADY